MDAGRVPIDWRRLRTSEDTVQFRRVSMGILLATINRRAYGASQARRPSRQQLLGGAYQPRASYHDAFRATAAAALCGRTGPCSAMRTLEAGDLQRQSATF